LYTDKAVIKSKKKLIFILFSNMCETWVRIRMRIGIILMPIRICDADAQRWINVYGAHALAIATCSLCIECSRPYKPDMSAEPNTCALFFVLNARMGAGDGASL
jgi:hypothetical protein